MAEPERRADAVGRESESRHPISVAAERSGVAAHTLRAWERRYGVVEPGRTEGGHRLYSDEDVGRLRLLRELTEAGRRIGRLAPLTTPELLALLREDRAAAATSGRAETGADASGAADAYLEDALAAVRALEGEKLDGLLRRAALALSVSAFLEDLVVPLMERIGQAWEGREIRPAHEHLASAVVTRIGGWLLDNVGSEGAAPRLAVATPAGHRHELGALGAAVSARSEGWRVSYLGADLPAADIALAARDTSARAVALGIAFPGDRQATEEELRELRRRLPPGLPLLVGGAGAEAFEDVLADIRAVRIEGFSSLRAVLRTLGGGE